MIKATKQYLGVKYCLGQTGVSRFSSGKLHLLHWDKTNRRWILHCRPDDVAGMHVYNLAFPTFVSDNLPTTCMKCDSMIKRVFRGVG